MQKILIFGLLLLGLSACQISGLTSGYAHLTDNEKQFVFDNQDNIEQITDHSKIYTITPKQIREYAKKHQKVVVYDYTPYCRSAMCVSPEAFHNRLQSMGVELIVVTNIYDGAFNAINLSFPLLVINAKTYKTKWRAKYIRLFYEELIGERNTEKVFMNYHVFVDGQYKDSYRSVEEVIGCFNGK